MPNYRISKEEELKVVGMHCATCVETVTKAILSVQGVKDASVNLTSGEAKIIIEDNKKLKNVIQAIRKAGYDIITLEFIVKLNINQDEIGKVKDIIENIDGVISVKAGMERVIVELNPLSVSPEVILDEINRKGYKANIETEKITKRSEYKDFLVRLLVAVFTTLPLLFVNNIVLQLILSIPTQFYSGYPFHRGMIRAIRNGTTNMDVLVSLSSNTAWIYSLIQMFIGKEPFFLTSSSLITFILIGKLLEAFLKEKISEDVIKLTQVKARKIENGKEYEINSNELKVGDLVIVKTGDIIPADGVVESGEATVDESIYTGEALPTTKKKGDPVIGGSIVQTGALTVYVTRSGNRAYISQVVSAIKEAEFTKLPIQKLVDKVSSIFVPFVIIISLLSSIFWYYIFHAAFTFSLLIGIAVLASACPCGFGLATPTAIMIGIRKLAKRGIIVRNGDALQRLNETKRVIFDKTGTITSGKIKIMKAEGDIQLASALESLSNHPIAKAISQLHSDMTEKKIENFTEFQGQGVYGKINGHEIIVGKKEFVLNNCQTDEIVDDADILVCKDGKLEGKIWIADEIRPEAKMVIEYLKKHGYDLEIATGDSSKFADEVAKSLGLKLHKGLSAEEKAELVKEKPTVFIGDGVNDAIALKESHVGIAISSGTDIAKYAGDIIISNLSQLPYLLSQSARIVRKVKENVLWALVYNIILMPLAAGLLYPHIYISPEIAALAMSMNSVSVVLWSLVQ
ncbi:ATPase P [Sulfolobus acidocaldarius SUSAZ]|nr:ATPase P [Sulfolobus acidocaldarius SUSAZ]